jgi:hypothetical protein
MAWKKNGHQTDDNTVAAAGSFILPRCIYVYCTMVVPHGND